MSKVKAKRKSESKFKAAYEKLLSIFDRVRSLPSDTTVTGIAIHVPNMTACLIRCDDVLYVVDGSDAFRTFWEYRRAGQHKHYLLDMDYCWLFAEALISLGEITEKEVELARRYIEEAHRADSRRADLHKLRCLAGDLGYTVTKRKK